MDLIITNRETQAQTVALAYGGVGPHRLARTHLAYHFRHIFRG